jgi:hypothetical protein
MEWVTAARKEDINSSELIHIQSSKCRRWDGRVGHLEGTLAEDGWPAVVWWDSQKNLSYCICWAKLQDIFFDWDSKNILWQPFEVGKASAALPRWRERTWECAAGIECWAVGYARIQRLLGFLCVRVGRCRGESSVKTEVKWGETLPGSAFCGDGVLAEQISSMKLVIICWDRWNGSKGTSLPFDDIGVWMASKSSSSTWCDYWHIHSHKIKK